MNYYIADPHLGHENIIRLCNRPFKTVEEMDEAIIRNWNSTVGPKDDVYILGDLIFKSAKWPGHYLERLNGRKHLIVGNHDGKVLKQANCKRFFESINDFYTVHDEKYTIFLCHYPVAEWPGFYRNTFHFFGHIHNSENDAQEIMRKIKNCYNVGADLIGFTPRTAEEIISGKISLIKLNP